MKYKNQEFILWAEKSHWILLLPFGLSLIIIFPLFHFTNNYIMLVLPPSCLLLSLPQIFFNNLALTNKNLRGSFGLSQKCKFVIPLQSIDKITIYVSNLGTVFNYGTFVIKTSTNTYTVKNISKANLFKSQILTELQSKKAYKTNHVNQ